MNTKECINRIRLEFKDYKCNEWLDKADLSINRIRLEFKVIRLQNSLAFLLCINRIRLEFKVTAISAQSSG